MNLLIGATVVAVCYVLWSRRFTIAMQWERATTANVIGLTLCMALIAPWTTAAVDPPLHTLTGLWNVEDLLGHLSYLCGLGALLHTMISRLDYPDWRRRRKIRARLELPLVLWLPIAAGLFVIADKDRNHPAIDFIDESGQVLGWDFAYWLLISATSLWIIANLYWVLLILRKDGRSRVVANIYLAAVTVDVACNTMLCLNAAIPSFPSWPAWVTMCVATWLYVGGAWWSWKCKLRYFNARATGFTIKPLPRPRVPAE